MRPSSTGARLGALATLLILALAPASAAAADEKALLRVSLSLAPPDPSGFVDADQQQREDSLRDLLKRMPKQTKHWRIALAPTPAAADVQITLTSAQREDTGSRHHDRYGGTESALRRPVIRTTVRVGSYETELINTPTNMTWRGAAGDWWQDFAAWADRNTAAIRQQLTTDH